MTTNYTVDHMLKPKWTEIAARRYIAGNDPPPFVGRFDGIMGMIDNYKNIGVVSTMLNRTTVSGFVVEKLLAWPKIKMVERELAALEMISKRNLHHAIVVNLRDKRLGLILCENVLDARVGDLVTGRETLVMFDELRTVEEYGFTPEISDKYREVFTMSLKRTHLGTLKWPDGVAYETVVPSRWRQATKLAIFRRYQ